MAEILVTKIRTSEGDLQIDYNALANLPDIPAVDDVETLKQDVIDLANMDAHLEQRIDVNENILNSHLSNTNNPHNVMAHQVGISEELASEMGLPSPSFVSDAIGSNFGDITNIYGMIYGTTPGVHRWKKYQWECSYNTINKSAGTSDTFDSSFTSLKASKNITINDAGEIALVDPVTYANVTSLFLDVGTYFQVTERHTVSNHYSAIMRVKEESYGDHHLYSSADGSGKVVYDEVVFYNVDVVSTYQKYIGSETSDKPDTYQEDVWINGTRYVKDNHTVVQIPRLEHNSYTGIGSGDTAVIVFNIDPKFVMIYGEKKVNKNITNRKTTNAYGQTFTDEAVINVNDIYAYSLTYCKTGSSDDVLCFTNKYSFIYEDTTVVDFPDFDLNTPLGDGSYDTSLTRVSYDEATFTMQIKNGQFNEAGMTYYYTAIG